MYRVSTNFILEEFIDPETFSIFGERSVWFIDPVIVRVVQFIRDRHGVPVTVNNWHIAGGKYNESGYRRPNTTTGGKLSQHKFGRASDIKTTGITRQELYKDIIDNQSLYMKVGLTTVEHIDSTPSWVHLDCRYIPDIKEIFIVKP